MTVTINKNDYERILAHARENLPEEACGLIAGIDREDGVREIKKVYLLTNIDHTNEHFSIDPKDQLASIKDMRAEGLKPLGNWHSSSLLMISALTALFSVCAFAVLMLSKSSGPLPLIRLMMARRFRRLHLT